MHETEFDGGVLLEIVETTIRANFVHKIQLTTHFNLSVCQSPLQHAGTRFRNIQKRAFPRGEKCLEGVGVNATSVRPVPTGFLGMVHF